MSSLGVKGCTKSWEAHERDQQFGENERIHIGKSHRLQREVDARINKVSGMKPGLAKIIYKVLISWYFESPEIDLHIAENACSIDYADTWSSKQVHWLSKSRCPHCGTPDYGCEDRLKLNTGVTRARVPIMGIHTRVALKSKIHWLPVTFHNSRLMDHCQICNGSIEVISILDHLDVEEVYRHIASHCHSVKWRGCSHGQRVAWFG